MIPRGLPVGTAVKGLDGSWRVRLDSDSSSIDFVRILLFKDFSLLANQQELAQDAAPSRPPPQGQPSSATPAPAAASPSPGAVSIAAPKPAPAPPAPVAAPSDKEP
jgi:rod shape-determining protein MreC